MISLEKHFELAAAMPAAGEASILRGVLSQVEAAEALHEADLGSHNYIPFGRHRPGLFTDTIRDLVAVDLFPQTTKLLQVLGGLANTDSDRPHILCIGPIATPHRDPPHRQITFSAVLSGEVNYNFGGKQLGRKHYGLVTHDHAVAGDVLCINNDVPPKKRLLHSTVATGRRLVIEFFDEQNVVDGQLV